MRDGEKTHGTWLDAATDSTVQAVQTSNLPSLEAILQYTDCPEEMAEDSDIEDDDE